MGFLGVQILTKVDSPGVISVHLQKTSVTVAGNNDWYTHVVENIDDDQYRDPHVNLAEQLLFQNTSCFCTSKFHIWVVCEVIRRRITFLLKIGANRFGHDLEEQARRGGTKCGEYFGVPERSFYSKFRNFGIRTVL